MANRTLPCDGGALFRVDFATSTRRPRITDSQRARTDACGLLRRLPAEPAGSRVAYRQLARAAAAAALANRIVGVVPDISLSRSGRDAAREQATRFCFRRRERARCLRDNS